MTGVMVPIGTGLLQSCSDTTSKSGECKDRADLWLEALGLCDFASVCDGPITRGEGCGMGYGMGGLKPDGKIVQDLGQKKQNRFTSLKSIMKF